MLLHAAILTLAQQCAPNVNPHTMETLIAVESSGNPYAIGVVGTSLAEQPQSLDEALEISRFLLDQGANISVGLGQINKNNFEGLGITLEEAFDPCTNLKASSTILTNCYERATDKLQEGQKALMAAFSCYYSNNFTRGFAREGTRPSYVMKVAENSRQLRNIPAIEFQPHDIKEVTPDNRPAQTQPKEPEPVLEVIGYAEDETSDVPDKKHDRTQSWDVFGEFSR